MSVVSESTAALTNGAATLTAKTRNGLIVANPSDTVMTVRFGATATAVIGIPLAANASLCLIGRANAPSTTVSIFCAGTSKTYVAYEW